MVRVGVTQNLQQPLSKPRPKAENKIEAADKPGFKV